MFSVTLFKTFLYLRHCCRVVVFLYIHTYTLFFFFINLIVKSIETFVVCAVSRIKLLLLLYYCSVNITDHLFSKYQNLKDNII